MAQASWVLNHSKDYPAPTQPAAATAIATGVRVTNRAIAIDGDGKPIKSIVELAREYGRDTGLVTDTKLTDPPTAAFYAHPLIHTDLITTTSVFPPPRTNDPPLCGIHVHHL